MGEWREVHVGTEGDDAMICGMEVWKHDWRHVGERSVQLPHPNHPRQRHSFEVYEIGPTERKARFAAAELSNGVWGFYEPV